eukprot:scaffold109959_cov19-Prasinocladus_malaysianus.AAC.1
MSLHTGTLDNVPYRYRTADTGYCSVPFRQRTVLWKAGMRRELLLGPSTGTVRTRTSTRTPSM